MEMEKENTIPDPRDKEELAKSLALIDQTVNKKYISNLHRFQIFCPNFHVEGFEKNTDKGLTLQIGSNATMMELTRFVYDEDENIQDKLVSIYHAISSYEDAKIFMLIRSNEMEQRVFLGVSSDKSEQEFTLLSKQLEALENNFVGNFPGSTFKKFQAITRTDRNEAVSAIEQKRNLLKDVFAKGKSIAAVSGIPSLKSDKRDENKQFVQGIEKVLDSIIGMDVDILILAEPVLADEVKAIINGYEEIYSNISPYSKSAITVSSSNSESVTDTLTKGITETTNESVAKTHTHTLTQGKSSSNSIGGHIDGHVGFGKNVKVVDLGVDYHHTWSRHEDEADSDGETITEGTSSSLNEQNSVANGLTSSHSDGLQLEYENKTIQRILHVIDRQLERMNECEDYGMYDCGVYVLSKNYANVLSASTSFKSIMRGKESSTESSYINTWRSSGENDPIVNNILQYLSTFNHPVFALRKKSEESEMVLPVTPASTVSGRELAIEMGMPRKSISGIPVIKTARFGRKVLYVDEGVRPAAQVAIGKIYHMNTIENTEVMLNAQSFTSHVFITGSTGSGKSTTVYKLLSETLAVVEGCRFLVIEPAKGEYKTVFGGRKDVKVYGTNLYEIDKMIRINPFSFPEDKIHVLEHIDKLIGIFNACWPMYAAMPAVLKDAIERAYIEAGWDLTWSECKYKKEIGTTIFPSFSDVLNQINQAMNDSDYSDDSKGDYKGALVTRLKSLTNGINGLVFSTDELTGKELFDENVIVDLSRVSGDETKSLIMGMLLIKQQEYRIANRKGINESLKHITVLEEAHNILKRTSTEQPAESSNLIGKSVEMIASAIAEMRTYGESFIIVDQSPSAVDMSAIRNTNTKIIMRLPDVSDREQVGKSAGLNEEQIAELSRLKTGVAAIYQNNWVEPVLCQTDGSGFSPKPYTLPENYSANWSGDEKIVRDVVDMMLSRFLETNYITTNAFLNRILKSGLDALTKVKIYEYHRTEDEQVKVKLAEDVVYHLLYNDSVWRKSLEYRDNIEEWYKQMSANIRPDISDMDRDSINVILQILAYKQERLYEENKKNAEANEVDKILQQLVSSKIRSDKNV